MTPLPSRFREALARLGLPETPRVLTVSVSRQMMSLFENGSFRKDYPVSTSEKGTGQQANSYQTPAGLHRIREKIGADAPLGAIFRSRKHDGEIWRPTDPENPQDLITTRILWLEGLQPGFNCGTDDAGTVVDSHQRYIYIHGTNHEDRIGRPESKGCVRMRNPDVRELFDAVKEGDLVWIEE